MAENKDKKILDALFEPESIKESVAFSASMSILQIIGLFAFSFLGATISFGFGSWFEVISSYDYWAYFVVMTGEQFYAYNIAYQFAISVLSNSEKYKKAIQEGDDIINGVYDPELNKWLITPLRDDSAYIDIALNQMNSEERERLYKRKITKKIDKLNQKISDIEAKQKPKFFLFKKRRITKRLIRIESLKRTINYLEAKQNDKVYMDAIDDRKIPGFTRVELAAIYSGQESEVSEDESKYTMRKRKTYERKGAGKRALVRFLTGLFLPLVAWGAVTLKGGAVISMIVMMIMQFSSGWQQAIKNFKKADMFNAEQRFTTIKEIQHRVPGIKAKELAFETAKKAEEIKAAEKLKAEIEKAEIEAYEENKRRDYEKATRIKLEQEIIKSEKEATEAKIRVEAERIAYEARVKAEAEELIKRQQAVKLATP